MSERTFIVDQHGQNFMYRTNMPIKDGKFQYDELVEVFKQKADEAGLEFPSEFQLVDISLINKSDYVDLNIERNFFKQNPEKGRFRNYIIIGSLLFPNSLGAKFRNWMAQSYEYWNYDQQNDLNKYMHDILIDTTTELPQIIFFHCEAGEDRTGVTKKLQFLTTMLKLEKYTILQEMV
ncbi:hypothetical protein PPERSA_05183 [Pseudocohnilembus persalinus]|uniref:Tyrosine specific protein phosphatases domain-containing protein n=1 Tax=Pseudocohnilembus persalinus TaxID=266149 RepID=A0A0V0R9F4_PSEPJ|nr:hypothetical protein PPERSA_05183 [Pseudocohnilembus persalinus]|eukprot:KRX11074.1 hypothetical protein PPERSA_05183 [Pseudocohnilembus persalinus]